MIHLRYVWLNYLQGENPRDDVAQKWAFYLKVESSNSTQFGRLL